MAEKFKGAQKDELLEHIRNGMRPGAAAEALGFRRTDIFELLDEDEDFAAQVTLANREATEHVEEALYQAAVSGNVTAARMWLERSEERPSTALVTTDADEPGFDKELAELNALAAGKDEE